MSKASADSGSIPEISLQRAAPTIRSKYSHYHLAEIQFVASAYPVVRGEVVALLLVLYACKPWL